MLAGLIIASAEVDGATTLRAELPVAGQTLLEQQARLLASAGAQRITVLVERLPPGLLGAVDRLKRDGIAVDLARSVEDAADRAHPDERLLVLADALVTDPTALEMVLAAPAPAVLVLPDKPDTRGWELIGANARWAGVMLLDGTLLRRTAAMLGEWDLQSTLLRRAVQAGATFVDATRADPPPLLAIVDTPDTALAAEQAIGRRATRHYTGYPDRFVFAPLAHAVAPRAMKAMVDPLLFRIGAVAVTGLALLSLLIGWRWPALILMLGAGPLDTVGRHIAALGQRGGREHRRWSIARRYLGGAVLLALGWHLTRTGGGWGCFVLALAALAFLGAEANHERLVGRPARRPLWLAEPDTIAWGLVPFALFGAWTVGLAAIALLAFASLLQLQKLTARARA